MNTADGFRVVFEGGPLMPCLALNAFGIWFYFLRAQARFGAALARQSAFPEQQFGAGGVAGEERGAHGLPLGLDRDFIILAALTGSAPLLGLLGTVIGMILTFQAVSEPGGDLGVGVAGGISQALITTQTGLLVAMPGLFGLERLRHLRAQLRSHLAACRIAALLARYSGGVNT